MDFLKNVKKAEYSKKITQNKYSEGKTEINSSDGYSSILAPILKVKDYDFVSNEITDFFINKKNIEIATIADNDDNWNNKFNKKFKKQVICAGLQKKRHFSSVLYYNEYYNINIIILNISINKYYKTCLKNYQDIIIAYDTNKFILYDGDLKDKEESELNYLNNIFEMDVDCNFIYNKFLPSLSSLKLEDLVTHAKEFKIDLLNDKGKKKTKKDLYEEINLFKLNN
jgi:hypothetical protein